MFTRALTAAALLLLGTIALVAGVWIIHGVGTALATLGLLLFLLGVFIGATDDTEEPG